MRILSGIQPSGKLHLGNYFGAIVQYLRYQEQSTQQKPLYFIADLHALTTVREGKVLQNYCLDVALDYLAFGLDPQKSIIFRQSEVIEHTLLAWILSTVTPVALLERGHSYKDKIAKGISPDAGLFTYPVLMAADILLYDTDLVPVGKDQKQHLEFTRDICTKLNTTYGQDLLKMPEALILEEVAVIPGLDGQKMSKSYNNTIEVFGEENLVRKKIMSITTDSTPVEAPKSKDSALFMLLKLLAPASEFQNIEKSWTEGGVGYGTYKKQLVDLFFAHFNEARNKRLELQKNLDYVQQVLKQGSEEAHAVATPVMQRVKQAVGL